MSTRVSSGGTAPPTLHHEKLVHFDGNDLGNIDHHVPDFSASKQGTGNS